MFFTICFIILGIGLTSLIWGIADNEDGFIVWGATISLIVAGFGFGIIGGTGNWSNKEYLINNIRKTKTDSALVVEYIDGNRVGQIQSSDIYIYNNSDKIDHLNVTQRFNAYGGMLGEKIEVDRVDLIKKNMGEK